MVGIRLRLEAMLLDLYSDTGKIPLVFDTVTSAANYWWHLGRLLPRKHEFPPRRGCEAYASEWVSQGVPGDRRGDDGTNSALTAVEQRGLVRAYPHATAWFNQLRMQLNRKFIGREMNNYTDGYDVTEFSPTRSSMHQHGIQCTVDDTVLDLDRVMPELRTRVMERQRAGCADPAALHVEGVGEFFRICNKYVSEWADGFDDMGEITDLARSALDVIETKTWNGTPLAHPCAATHTQLMEMLDDVTQLKLFLEVYHLKVNQHTEEHTKASPCAQVNEDTGEITCKNGYPMAALSKADGGKIEQDEFRATLQHVRMPRNKPNRVGGNDFEGFAMLSNRAHKIIAHLRGAVDYVAKYQTDASKADGSAEHAIGRELVAAMDAGEESSHKAVGRVWNKLGALSKWSASKQFHYAFGFPTANFSREEKKVFLRGSLQPLETLRDDEEKTTKRKQKKKAALVAAGLIDDDGDDIDPGDIEQDEDTLNDLNLYESRSARIDITAEVRTADEAMIPGTCPHWLRDTHLADVWHDLSFAEFLRFVEVHSKSEPNENVRKKRARTYTAEWIRLPRSLSVRPTLSIGLSSRNLAEHARYALMLYQPNSTRTVCRELRDDDAIASLQELVLTPNPTSGMCRFTRLKEMFSHANQAKEPEPDPLNPGVAEDGVAPAEDIVIELTAQDVKAKTRKREHFRDITSAGKHFSTWNTALHALTFLGNLFRDEPEHDTRTRKRNKMCHILFLFQSLCA